MNKTTQTKSDILAIVHETAIGMHNASLINQTTMNEFDALCLSPTTSSELEKNSQTLERTDTTKVKG
jgi:DNA-binding transcriptional regulator YiaG